MREKIKKFVCSLQSPEDGYIHHPQWSGKKEGKSRIARDLTWAVDLEKKFGFKLPYPTAYERLKAISEGVADEKEIAAQPLELRSKEAFLEYISAYLLLPDLFRFRKKVQEVFRDEPKILMGINRGF